MQREKYKMIDEFAIQQTLNKYSDGASKPDWDQVMATFLPEAIWEIPVLKARYQGHAAMLPVMSGFVAQMDYFVQINSSAIITVDGDKATARSTIRECGKLAGRNEVVEVLGFYDDELVRTSEGWKFSRRTFHPVGKHTYALLPAA
jgi:SnoaL-like domain